MKNHSGLVVGLLLVGELTVTGPVLLAAQGINEGRWPVQPMSRTDRVIAPFLEGWYVNDDETVTYSFGYLNINDDAVEIPIGENNRIEPAELSGMQPTVFLPGRRRGVFAITVPASMRQDDVWWTITNPNGQVTRVPGRTSWTAYRLDWRPRAHGTLPPEVSFEGGQRPLGPGMGPAGVFARQVVSTSVGAPTTLAVNVRDVSVRAPDETDPQLRGPTPVRVVWTPYQGPLGATVEFSRHPSTPTDTGEDRSRSGSGCYSALPCAELSPAQIIGVPSGRGTVQVIATFSEPGEYVIHAQVDNWGLADSSFTDQCCHSNGYVRVAVTAQ